MKSEKNIRPKDHVRDVIISDIVVGGDIHRIILSGIETPAGRSALDVRNEFMRDHDTLRRVMLSYPYGNEDMCADLVFRSSHEDADFGYIIMECMGYPHFSGSNTMATISALVEYGFVPHEEGLSEIRLEAPSGIIDAQYRVRNGLVEEVIVQGDDSYVVADGLSVVIPELGTVEYAIVWSGACFIMVDAKPFQMKVDAANIQRMKEVGYAVIETVRKDFSFAHPEIGPIESVGFVHFMGDFEATGDKAYRGWGATYGHPATVFNCPTGTGTAARMALEVARGRMESDALFENISAAGNAFIGRGMKMRTRGGQEMLRANIAARPFVLSTTTMHLDFENPVMTDFAKLQEVVTG